MSEETSTDPNVVLPVLLESIVDAITLAASTVPKQFQNSNALQEVQMVGLVKGQLAGRPLKELLGICVMLFRFGGTAEKLKQECNAVINLTNALMKSQEFMDAQAHTHAWMKSFIPDIYEQIVEQASVSQVAASITDAALKEPAE